MIDNIYPTGIPRFYWEDGAYEVALACSSEGAGSTTVGKFAAAVEKGVGEITVESPPNQ